MNLNLKYQSTGNNDSIQDAIMIINNIKKIDGKYVSINDKFNAVYVAWKASRTAFGVTNYETT